MTASSRLPTHGRFTGALAGTVVGAVVVAKSFGKNTAPLFDVLNTVRSEAPALAGDVVAVADPSPSATGAVVNGAVLNGAISGKDTGADFDP